MLPAKNTMKSPEKNTSIPLNTSMASPKNMDLQRISTSESLTKIFLSPESDAMNDIDTYLSTHCTNEQQAYEGSNGIDKENTVTTEQSEDNSDQQEVPLQESSKSVVNNILKRLTSCKRKRPTRTDLAPSPEKVPKTKENTEIVNSSSILTDSLIVNLDGFEEEIDDDQLTDIVNNENVLDQSACLNWNSGFQLGKNNIPKDSNQKLNATSAKKDQASFKDGSPKAKEGNKQIQTKYVQAIKELFSIFKTIKSFTNVLSSKEKQLLHKFENLNELQQYIVLKLYTRKKTWYNNNGLIKFCEMVNMTRTEDTTDLFCILCKEEFLEYSTPLKAIRIKDDIVEAFDNFCLLTLCTNPTFQDIQDYFRFYNEKHFPKAPLSDFPIFYSREKFLQYAQAMKLQNKLEIVCEISSIEEKLAAINEVANEALSCLSDLKDNTDHVNEPYLNRFTAAHVYSKILFSCCEKLFGKKNDFSFQVKQWLEFLIQKFPCSRRLGKWYLKLIRLNMRHLKPISYDVAAKLLIEVLTTKQSYLGERIKYELECLAQSLKNSKRHKINKNDKEQLQTLIPSLIDASSLPAFTFRCPAISSNPIGKKRTYTQKCYNGVILSHVEALAMRKYSEDYPKGSHSEGSHIHSLLVLYFWDIIYNVEENVSHVFISRLQNVPLDMFSGYFYENRKDAVDKRLREIDCEWSKEKLYEFGVTNWQEHSDKSSVFGTVQSVIHSQEMVKNLFEVIGRQVLAKIFQRLIKNLAEYKIGMPDLLVWNTETKTHKFVEVKSENDRLAAHKTLWLVYLQEVGANVEICYVKDS